MSAKNPAVDRSSAHHGVKFTLELANKKDSHPMTDHLKRISLRYSFWLENITGFPMAP